MKYKLLLFDLDGTLLNSDKSISAYTLSVLDKCRNMGLLIGVSTSRSEQNSINFLSQLLPDILISSGGALVKLNKKYIYKAEFSIEETKQMIRTVREICGPDSEITIDTIDNHYWNYKIDPKQQDQSWGDSIYTDFNNFNQTALKMCVEIFDSNTADRLKNTLADCDCIRFSDGYWYKFTKKGITKENAIREICLACNITPENIIAFGDDYSDIGMLKLCGMGVAMGNAIQDVKDIADVIIGTNDTEGIANYLIKEFNIINYSIREMKTTEYSLLEDFLYEAIFVPKGIDAPSRSIINSPELQIYVADFGTQKHDRALLAEINGKVIGAVWVRIMNDYGHIDDKTPSFAISLYKEYRGLGIGTVMMKEMLNTLKKAEYERVSLSVQKANYAVKMYLKLGFEIVEETEEEYIMIKRL